MSLPEPARCRILDVGCGDGLFFPKLRAFGSVDGIEVDQSLLSPDNPDRPRIRTALLGSSEYADWAAPGGTFDLITALDVIEHIEDDRHAVRCMLDMLRPGGALLLTVPALMCLWDRHDEINHHFRRYTRASLGALIESAVGADGSGAGTTARRAVVLDLRYFFHALVLPKYVVRVINRIAAGKPGAAGGNKAGGQGHGASGIDQFKMPPAPISFAMRRFCDLEERLGRHLPIPFGTSLLAVVRRS